MPKKKEIFTVLPKKQLVEISHFLGFRSWQVISKGEIVKRLSRQRKKPIEEILNLLKITELRQICTKLNLNPGGLKKQTLIDRILGNENDTKPKQKKLFQAKKKDKTEPKPPFKLKTIAKPKQVKKRNNRIIKMQQNNHANAELEKHLWDAADQLRANSSLTAQEYSRPVLGLIFLKFADHRFSVAEKKISKESQSSRITIGKLHYQAMGVMYLPDKAR